MRAAALVAALALLLPCLAAAQAQAKTWAAAQTWALALGGGAALLAGGLLGCVYLLPAWFLRVVARHAHPSVLFCAPTTARVCALTIDDAPSASTARILDVLREHKVRATFFIISSNIEGYEAVVQRIVDEGHALGNHLTEDRASILDDLHVFERKLQECDAAISKFRPRSPPASPSASTTTLATPRTVNSGDDVDDDDDDADSIRLLSSADGLSSAPKTAASGGAKWMRPASGWFTTPMRKVVERHGYRICLGSVYPHDAQIRSEIVNSIHLRARTRCGSVIIVHDRSWTVGVLRTALPELARKFSFVSLDELTAHGEHHCPSTASSSASQVASL